MQEIVNMSLFDLFDLDNESIEEIKLNLEDIKENEDNEKLKVKDEVYIEYKGKSYLGIIHSIYNNDETVNVIFDCKHSAFHKSKVKKA
ncbi:hypothetical protein OD350_29370 (plasmid) [Clostridium beijerinckii]|uniref:hypothetical protein n=1 Tax=Clostridium beijerinckii TaxID=1520 RepID=UPI0022267788|nr:hypothetical protein [Clostridium beijerinckii]UYZ39000.1 hypothetical protein OD350_29370 [Clostridium beijerinckii]